MDPISNYLILSLPKSAEADEWLEKVLNGGKCPLFKFELPDFQIGTLDSLVEECDELAKIDSQLETSVTKVIDVLTSTTESSATSKGASSISRIVDSKPVSTYAEKFQWKTSKYRLDKPISELVKLISNEAIALDGDVRTAYQGYQNARSNFLAADRKRYGDLSIRSLHEIVKPEQFVLDSEHLTTVLIAVPKSLISDFEDSYETLTQFVIPRSASVIATDKDYSLYTVTLFKKYQQDFTNLARERKWHPRVDFVYSEETLNELRKEFDISKATEAKARSDLIRLSKTAYSDIFSAWMHIKVIRVYGESVLRYGLPPQFDYFMVKFEGHTLKTLDKAKKDLITKFGYLGGDGFGNSSSLQEYASLVDTDYEPFVLFELPVF